MMEKARVGIITEAANETATIQLATERAAQSDQLQRENLIADIHEKIGQIRAADVFGKFATVSSLMWLKQVKDSKAYKDIPAIGTWEIFCNNIGLSRAKVDQDLLNLEILGEEFLQTVSNMQVGYRELRKLRQLKSNGALAIEGGLVKIGDEEIPLSPDHAEDLQAAIETVLEQRDKQLEEQQATIKAKDKVAANLQKTIEKQENDLQRFEKDLKARGFAAGEEAFLKKLDRLKIEFQAVEAHLDPDNMRANLGEDATPRMIASYLELVGYINRVGHAMRDTAVEIFGTIEVDGSGWIPPYDRKSSED